MNLLLGTGSFYNNRLEQLRSRAEGSIFSFNVDTVAHNKILL